MSKKINIAIAGSTQRTVICADAVKNDPRFEIQWVLTPSPKILGRKKIVTENPLHSWANSHQIATVLLEQKIDVSIKENVLAQSPIDFLLVVDFGYLVPSWLLQLPSIAPLNIHPSLLPKWRGSSPGQFALLYGEKESAVTLMVMDEGLDSGAIVSQIPFAVDQNWTQNEYYQHSFALIQQQLATLISNLADGKLSATPQPILSPTPIARRLSREDGFVEWSLLDNLRIFGSDISKKYQLNTLLSEAYSAHQDIVSLIVAASHALSPWPGLWTIVTTSKGQTRMKIISCSEKSQRLVLETVQFEGKQATSWEEAKNTIIDLLD